LEFQWEDLARAVQGCTCTVQGSTGRHSATAPRAMGRSRLFADQQDVAGTYMDATTTRHRIQLMPNNTHNGNPAHIHLYPPHRRLQEWLPQSSRTTLHLSQTLQLNVASTSPHFLLNFGISFFNKTPIRNTCGSMGDRCVRHGGPKSPRSLRRNTSKIEK
jgi:hypothetical protein